MSIGDRVNRPADVRTFAQTDLLVDNSVYIGYEVEVEGVRALPNLSGLWVSKPDGSLRNDGVEFVFAHPLKGADVVAAIVEIMTTLIKVKCDMSHRCGAHVHVDVRDMDENSLACLISHAIMFERALYAYAGDGRDDNIFCLPYYKAEGGLYGFGDMMQHRNLEYLLSAADKYYGINLKAIQRYGSVEFRMLSGTVEVPRILAWINVLLSIRKASVNMGSADKFLHTVSSSGMLDYAAEVFAGVPEFLPYVKERDMYEGMRLAQSFLNSRGLSAAYKSLPKKLGKYSLIAKFAAANNLRLICDAVKETNANPLKPVKIPMPHAYIDHLFRVDMVDEAVERHELEDNF